TLHHAQLLHYILYMSCGGQAKIEDRLYRLAPMRVVNVPIGDVHGYSFIRGTQGWVLTIAAEVMDQVLLPSEGLRRVLSSATVLRGTAQMRATMKLIFTEYAGRRFARAHILRSLTAMLIGLVAREMATKGAMPDG